MSDNKYEYEDEIDLVDSVISGKDIAERR